MPGLLPLLQITDSAFPTGAFSHSAGLEGLVGLGRVHDVATLEIAVRDQLDGWATSDLPVLRAVMTGSVDDVPALVDVAALDRLLAATRLTREQRTASSAVGRALLESVASLGVDVPYRDIVRRREVPGSQAVAFGVAAVALGVRADDAVAGYAFAGCSGLLAAGQKLLGLGQRDTQRTLFALHPAIEAAVALSATHDPYDPYSFTPVLEVASMSHERQSPRMYIS